LVEGTKKGDRKKECGTRGRTDVQVGKSRAWEEKKKTILPNRGKKEKTPFQTV